MSTDDTSATSTTRSGITVSASGERHIPSSVRSDGSVRKEIRIRPGYRPPEDVEVYKNRAAESWKTRSNGPVPGAEPAAEGQGSTAPKSASANKNAKRREAKRKAANANDANEDLIDSNGPNTSCKDVESANTSITSAPIDKEEARAKEVRRLQKKLRQARDLQVKKESGEALLPEQLEKVIKINELTKQLAALGIDGSVK